MFKVAQGTFSNFRLSGNLLEGDVIVQKRGSFLGQSIFAQVLNSLFYLFYFW